MQQRLAKKFRETGSVCDRKHVRHVGTVTRSPRKSLRILQKEIGVFTTSCRADRQLKLRAFRSQSVYYLQARDTAARIQYFWFLPDGVPALTAHTTADFLQEFFGDRIARRALGRHNPAWCTGQTPCPIVMSGRDMYSVCSFSALLALEHCIYNCPWKKKVTR